MKKIIICCIISVFMCSCSALYYGYLPGTEYQTLKPLTDIDLKGKSFSIEFKDSRRGIKRIDCSEYALDRETELEGKLGMDYLRLSITSMIENSNGRIDPQAPNKLIVELEALSFKLIGVGYVVVHGFIQFKVSSAHINKTYCSDMADHDEDSPLKWYSLVTRKTGSRLMVCGSTRRAVEKFVTDLSELNR